MSRSWEDMAKNSWLKAVRLGHGCFFHSGMCRLIPNSASAFKHKIGARPAVHHGDTTL
ncbi:MAG: hypothetical protein PVJ45_04340 [Desulfobacterales bacterium]